MYGIVQLTVQDMKTATDALAASLCTNPSGRLGITPDGNPSSYYFQAVSENGQAVLDVFLAAEAKTMTGIPKFKSVWERVWYAFNRTVFEPQTKLVVDAKADPKVILEKMEIYAAYRRATLFAVISNLDTLNKMMEMGRYSYADRDYRVRETDALYASLLYPYAAEWWKGATLSSSTSTVVKMKVRLTADIPVFAPRVESQEERDALVAAETASASVVDATQALKEARTVEYLAQNKYYDIHDASVKRMRLT